jgi:hypothetical protein
MSKVIFISLPVADYKDQVIGDKVRVENDSGGIESLVESFGNFLKAIGYSEQTVDAYLNPERIELDEREQEAKIEAEVARRVSEALEEKPTKRKLPKSMPSFLINDEEEHA